MSKFSNTSPSNPDDYYDDDEQDLVDLVKSQAGQPAAPLNHNRASSHTIPFGKYSGQQLSEVPPQYLRWMYSDWDFTRMPELQRALEAYLGLPPDPNVRLGSEAAQAYAAGVRNTAPKAQDAKDGCGQYVAGAGNPTPSKFPSGTFTRPGRHLTPVDAMRAAVDRVKREALAEYPDNPDVTAFVEDLLAKVRQALGI